jgi:hypothetical protein
MLIYNSILKMNVFQAGDSKSNSAIQEGVPGSGKEYRQGQYVFQNKRDPMADYQQTAGFRNGVNPELIQSKVKDKKMVFIEPLNKIEQENWLDKMIADILSLNKKEFADILPSEIEYLLNLIIPELEKEPIIAEVEAPIVISGDIHGQLQDLIRFFNQIGPPPHKKYLFQGDYVDRNQNDVEVITLLMSYKLRYPGYITMLRGNHECRLVN